MASFRQVAPLMSDQRLYRDVRLKFTIFNGKKQFPSSGQGFRPTMAFFAFLRIPGGGGLRRPPRGRNRPYALADTAQEDRTVRSPVYAPENTRRTDRLGHSSSDGNLLQLHAGGKPDPLPVRREKWFAA